MHSLGVLLDLELHVASLFLRLQPQNNFLILHRFPQPLTSPLGTGWRFSIPTHSNTKMKEKVERRSVASSLLELSPEPAPEKNLVMGLLKTRSVSLGSKKKKKKKMSGLLK